MIKLFSPDTGVVGDGITDASTLTLTGTAVANSTVKAFDGTTQIGFQVLQTAKKYKTTVTHPPMVGSPIPGHQIKIGAFLT